IDITDPSNKFVYLYDPHMPDEELMQTKYWILDALKKIYEKNGFIVKPIPEIMLRQTNLPLCYMYAIHFFLYLFVTRDLDALIMRYPFDTIYIMSFTRYILKLCNQYKLINDPEYYILTDNSYQIQNVINENTEINNLLSLVSSRESIKL